MEELTKQQLLKVRGGAISATYLNAIVKGIDALFDLGRSLGSSIKQIVTGTSCPAP